MNPAQNISFAQLQTLYEVSRKINTNLNLTDLLNEIMDLAIRLLDAEKGLIFLRDSQGKDLEIKIARAMDKKTLDNVLVLSRSIIDKVALDGKSVLVEKTTNSTEATKSMMRFKIKSLLCVPLTSRNKLIGVIYLDTTKPSNFFKQEHLAFLEAFANLAGIAIENAKNYQELEKLNQNLENLVEERTRELRLKHDELLQTYENLKGTQLQLVQAEKMASLGKLVAGIAHEINSPLGTIHSNTDVFSRGLKKLKEKIKIVDTMDQNEAANIIQMINDIEELTYTHRDATLRIQKIVKSLKNFARLDEGEIIEVDIHQGIDSTLNLIHDFSKSHIKIKKEYGEIPLLRCNASQLNQVFMNVLINACEAINQKGQIQIKTRQEKGSIIVEIGDTGIGISPELLKKVFDPGYTTKSKGIGTGLGLAISYRIIQDFGGTINLKSAVGKGTNVTIAIPIKT